METEKMIRELESVEEKHKDDTVYTGQFNIAEMAHDVRKRLEELKPYEDTGLTPQEILGLKENMNDGWIPVEERLPNDEEMMLVTCQKKAGRKSINRAWYGQGSWHGTGSMSGVIAWRPLPEPYCPERSKR